MIQYTTPTNRHIVKGIDLTGCDVWVSYEQGKRELDIKAADVTFDGEDTIVTVKFTQEQTSAFKVGDVKFQVNWVYPDGTRDATSQKTTKMEPNLLNKVVEYGDD